MDQPLFNYFFIRGYGSSFSQGAFVTRQYICYNGDIILILKVVVNQLNLINKIVFFAHRSLRK